MTDSSTQGFKTVLHPVSDLAKAKAVYAALLGISPQADAPYYVGFDAEGQHIGLVPGGGPQGMTSPVAYWHVPDIEAKLAEVTAAGATVKEPAHDVGGGRLVATVTDPDGNVVCFFQNAGKFKVRYQTLGFSEKAKLDDGAMWPNAYALTKLTATEEAKITALVKRAVR